MSVKSYKELNNIEKQKIIETYYQYKELNFAEIASVLNISKRSVARVLRENNINTKRKNRYTLNEEYFKKIDTEKSAYILGYIYADGYVGDEKFNNISITSIDQDIIEKIKCELEFTGEIRKGNKGNFENSSMGYVLNFLSKKMAKDLRNIGLYPNKSLTMTKIPEIPKHLIRHFIRGYFDGDGTVITSRNTTYHKVSGITKKYSYPTFSFELLGTEEFINGLLNYMDLDHYQILDTKTNEIKRMVCRAKKEAKKIYNYLYSESNIYMDRKYEKWSYVLSAFTK